MNQFVVTSNGTSAITTLKKTAEGDAFASTVWEQDSDGNGGYTSGSTLRTEMGKTAANVTVYDADGITALQEGGKADLVTFLTISDASSARGSGALFCGYNGVKLDGIAASGSSLTAADKAKVTNGAYTAWSYQQFYARPAAYTGTTKTIYDSLKAAIGANIGSAGIPTSEMVAGREVDGGTVAP